MSISIERTDEYRLTVEETANNQYTITMSCVIGSGGSSTIPGTPGNFVTIGQDNKPADSLQKPADFDPAGAGTSAASAAVSSHLSSAPHKSALSEMTEDTTHRTVTDTEKSTWNSKQDALGFTPENTANKGQALGYCGLDSGGKVPIANLPTTLLQYQGVWNASTNTPTLLATDLTKVGFVYNVSAAGSQFGIDWSLGDWAIYNAAGAIEKSDNSDDVTSVNGKTGPVVLDPDDLDDTNTNHKFVSSTEKSTWDGKQDALGFTPEDVEKKTTSLTESDTQYPANNAVNKGLSSIWDFVKTVSRVSDTQIQYTAASTALATELANKLTGRLARWTSSDGNTIKRGFITSVTSANAVVTINLNGNAFASGDINFRWSLPGIIIKQHQIFIPGTLFGEAADVGMEIIMPFHSRIISLSAYLKVAATGGSESTKFNIMDDGTGIFTTDLQITTGSSLLNQSPNSPEIAADSRLTARITKATGTTNVAQGLSLIIYFHNYNIWEV